MPLPSPARRARRGLPVAGRDPAASSPSRWPASPSSPPGPARRPSARSRTVAAGPAARRRRPTVDADEPSRKPTKPAVNRGKVYVEVFNNSGVTGLAGGVAAQRQPGGWNVVGSDNWYGTIPATTVYYPQAAQGGRARLLALDLGIQRTAPAVDPMQLDRLTVILTGRPRLTDRPAARRRRSDVVGLGAWSSPRPRASSGTPPLVARRRRPRRRPRLRRHPRADRRRPGVRRTSTPTRRRGARRPRRAGARRRGGHRPPGPPGARPRRPRGGRQRDRRRRPRAVRVRPVRQRALDLDQPPGDLARSRRAGWRRSARAAPLLRRPDAADACVEEKGLAVAVHTRRLDDPEEAFERLLPLLARAGQAPRPRRRARPQRHRGPLARHAQGLRRRARWSRSSTPAASSSAATTSATSRRSRPSRSCAADGLPRLLVCSASDEENALAELADVVVDGPAGVLDLLRELTPTPLGTVLTYCRAPERRSSPRTSPPSSHASDMWMACAHAETAALG